MKDPKLEYLDYWYSLSGNLGCTKSFGLKVWMQQQKKIDELEAIINKAWNAAYDEKDNQSIIDILEEHQ